MGRTISKSDYDWGHVHRALNTQIIGYLNVVFGSPESALEQVPELRSAIASNDTSELLNTVLDHYAEIAAVADLDEELRLIVETLLVWHASLQSYSPHPVPLFAVRRLFELVSVPTQEDDIEVVLARASIEAALDCVE